jgi:hypothetical protein
MKQTLISLLFVVGASLAGADSTGGYWYAAPVAGTLIFAASVFFMKHDSLSTNPERRSNND